MTQRINKAGPACIQAYFYRLDLIIAYIQASKFAFFIRIEASDNVNFFEYKRPAYIQNPLIFGEIRKKFTKFKT
ncbi:hypothetical protein BpHYR1_007055 [Brachionus plicatilis]|uniref:Uncharacterized protein n=1 Tax=Brachionus plicatilis TaxID=10195 RepID=A0A3M7QZB2_BRAPC|nr:hypothetical protein BpHYR1_007055 [Brachionus plicatilis]